ncbi:MAG TPA: glycosyltransferase family 2 protein [Chitinophagaceae bacterium]|nr:glycosyltransferase family 2 protein [Chitinophagaceae bacterium]
MASSPSVAIVILNWNGRHYLQQFLPSVLGTQYENLRIVVADNASSDSSVAFLQQHYPSIELIQLRKNFGFSKGYNEALKEVEADYYVLLNSDVEVETQWLNPLINLLEQDSDHAACQPKIMSYANKHLFEYAGGAGGWIDGFGYPFARGRIFDICEEDKGQYDTVRQVFWASGAALVIRSNVFHQMRGFDEFFFAHQEEIDLCWRMQRVGYKIFCCPQSVVYHVGGGTLPRGNSKKTFLNFRNNQIMLAKNLPSSQRWWKIPFRMLLDNISALKGLLSGDAGYFVAIIRAHAAFLLWLLLKRKKEKLHEAAARLPGQFKGNIAYEHFVKGKKTFAAIVLDEEY